VTIRYKSLTGNGQDANIEITTLGDGVPTMAPTASCGGVGRFQLDLQIDQYAFETAWELIDDDTNDVFYDEINDLYATAPKENHFSNKQYTYPVNGADYYCLDEGKCYTFKITDTYGDGLKAGQGGSYSGTLDGDVKFQGDGNFESLDVRKFCVGGGNNNPKPTTKAPTMKPTKAPTKKPTKSPTNKPTKRPTKKPTKSPTNKPTKSPTNKPTKAPTKKPTKSPSNKPTNPPVDKPTKSPTKKPTKSPTKAPVDDNDDTCKDDSKFLWKGQKKKNCKWVGKGTDPKIVKKCKRSNGDGKKVQDYCPQTCAKVKQGPCA